MTDYYLDSSALAKRYINEIGSAWVEQLCDLSFEHEIYIARVTCVEIVAAIARRTLGKSITLTAAMTAITLFRSDLIIDYQVLEITVAVAERAMALAEKYSLRGYDALQLAAACELNTLLISNQRSALTFISADGELNSAASREALATADPNLYP